MNPSIRTLEELRKIHFHTKDEYLRKELEELYETIRCELLVICEDYEVKTVQNLKIYKE